MAALHPAVAAVRTAVGAALDELTHAGALVACSGGADSLALAAAAGFVGRRRGQRIGLVTVDHGLQPGSADRAKAVAEWAVGAGFDPVVVETVDVAGRSGGPEAAARDARYEALVSVARRHGFSTVLLGHTQDDQAETVLLAQLRGAGLRGLAGMPAVRYVGDVALVRPLLQIRREQTRAACAAEGLSPWDDPHNADPAYARSRARALVAALTEGLGPAVVPNLARTARLAAADNDALEAIASDAGAACADDDGGLRVDGLAALHPAVRSRVLHDWARSLGAPGSALSHRHVAALDALVVGWHGQGPVYLPGAITVVRRDGRLTAPANPVTGARSG